MDVTIHQGSRNPGFHKFLAHSHFQSSYLEGRARSGGASCPGLRRSVAIPGHSIVRLDEGVGRFYCLLTIERCCARTATEFAVKGPAFRVC
jgi:hypothetical protein